MIYLAGPYSHGDPAVRQNRFENACWAAAQLIRRGKVVFAPIVHSHQIVKYGMAFDWDAWEMQDREHLKRCDEVIVLMLDGWQASVGVQAEIRIAQELGKPVSYVSPKDLVSTERSVAP